MPALLDSQQLGLLIQPHQIFSSKYLFSTPMVYISTALTAPIIYDAVVVGADESSKEGCEFEDSRTRPTRVISDAATARYC